MASSGIKVDWFADVFKDSWKLGYDGFKASYKKFSTYLWGSIGGAYTFKDKLLPDVNARINDGGLLKDHPYVKGALILVAYLILLFIWHQIKQFAKQAWRKFNFERKESVYGNAIILLSGAYSKVHKNRGKQLEVDEVYGILVEFCDKIRDIYSSKTKAECSVSIKTIVYTKGQGDDTEIAFGTKVVNLCRDSACVRRYSGDYETIEHKIANNTCYQRIISNFFSNKYNDLYFLSNDLPALDDYSNSSLELFPDYTEEKRATKESRRKHFPLKYRSELVVSITPLIKDDKREYPILGFICVDCVLERQEVFSKKYDVPLLLGVSDGLYDFMKQNLVKA